MKKKIAALVLTILCGLNATAVVGCNDGNTAHTHENKYYTVKQATCTEKGLIEVLCSTCGEKTYEEIQPVGHKMLNGVCSVCGYTENSSSNGSSENVPGETPETEALSAFYTFDDISSKATEVGGLVYFDGLQNLTLDDIYVNSLGFLKVCANGKFLNLGEVRKKYVFSDTPSEDNIRTIQITDGQMKVVYTDGRSITVGNISKTAKSIDDMTNELLDKGYSMDRITNVLSEKANDVIGIALNEENQAFVRMRDNRIVSIGNVLENKTETSDNVLVYKQREDGDYEIVGAMNGKVESIVIPPTHLGRKIVGIAARAFKGYTNLKEVNVMSGITEIGNFAFRGCVNLTTVTLSNGVTKIGALAFESCENLTTITLSDTLITLGSGAFANCKSLQSVALPNSVTDMGIRAFGGCEKLENVALGSGIDEIPALAFQNCKGLKRFTVPEWVVAIRSSAFAGCDNLTSVTFENVNGWRVGEKEILASNLTNIATAAVYLRETHANNIWYREQ